MRGRYRPWRVAMVIMSTTCAFFPYRRGPTEEHSTTSVESTAKRPNIVLIMADDLGYGDFGCYGGKVSETPHIDSLAKGGLRFADFHSAGAMCSPTRASILTGRYPQRFDRMFDGALSGTPQRHPGLPPEATTIAKMLSRNGIVRREALMMRTNTARRWIQRRVPENPEVRRSVA